MSYELTTKEYTTFESAGRFLRLIPDTEKMLRIAEEVVANWHLERELEFECVAQSDGGIDARDTKEFCAWRIPAHAVVFDGGKAVGIYSQEHLFLFDDDKSRTLCREYDQGYVGGWGNVTYTEEYTLMKGPAPEEAKEMLDVVAAVIVDGDRFYLTQRGYGNYKGLWEFPGGKVEPGETYEQALVREIREELGIRIRVERHLITTCHIYEEYGVLLNAYLCFIEEGEPTLKEHQAAQWLTIDGKGDLRWLPNALGVLEELRNQWWKIQRNLRKEGD